MQTLYIKYIISIFFLLITITSFSQATDSLIAIQKDHLEWFLEQAVANKSCEKEVIVLKKEVSFEDSLYRSKVTQIGLYKKDSIDTHVELVSFQQIMNGKDMVIQADKKTISKLNRRVKEIEVIAVIFIAMIIINPLGK